MFLASLINYTSDFLPWFYNHGLKVLAIALAAILADVLLKGFIAKKSLGIPVIERQLKQKINGGRKKRIQTIMNVIGGTLSFTIFVIAVLMILPEFGINIAPILAGIGLAGLAVSMAARDILSDFIAGLFILMEEQYNIGDKVLISGVEGTVKEITLRRTVVEADDGTIHLIPNREVKIVSKKSHPSEGGANQY